jgi:hypothetical protein
LHFSAKNDVAVIKRFGAEGKPDSSAGKTPESEIAADFLLISAG